MANALQLNVNTRLVEIKAKEILQRIKTNYEQGKIKSHTEYMYQVFHGLQTFYKSLGRPTMQTRLAWGPPFSGDYNQTMNEVYHDIITLFVNIEQVTQSLNESFRQVEVDRQNLTNRLKRIEDNMVELKAKRMQLHNEVIFRDSFIDQTAYDKELVEGIPASIWTREGILTLHPSAAESYTEDVSIRILEGNGFPGNTHQIRSISGTLKFFGEENMHLNLADILDGNLDTWFEYELFDVSDEVIRQTSNLGFEYKEGIEWITETEQSLRLVLEIELPTMKPVNWFSITPFLPNDKGVSNAVVKSIQIADGKGKVTEIIEEDEVFDEEKVYLFTQQNCKKITVALEQPNAYDTLIGHLFFKEMNEMSANYLDDHQASEGKRIDGELPSIEALGMKYNPETRQITQPFAAEGDVVENEAKRKQELFALPITNGSTLASFESLPAWRYMIGVRDAVASHYEFDETGEYRSVNFYSVFPIQSANLQVDEYIPKEFEDGDWIEYSISIDNGQNWHPIIPRRSRKEGKVLYLFNTNTPQEGRLPEFGYIDTDKPVQNIRLRIKLTRPTDVEAAKYYTPIVNDYELHVITQGDEINEY